MIFQHTWRQVISGSKTQTRRLRKPEESRQYITHETPLEFIPAGFSTGDIMAVRHGNNYPQRIKWSVGNTYAVQPARTLPAVGRIEITNIRLTDVRQITTEEVYSEGFTLKDDFLSLWHRMHGENYQAWALTFQLVDTPSSDEYIKAVERFVLADQRLKTAQRIAPEHERDHAMLRMRREIAEEAMQALWRAERLA